MARNPQTKIEITAVDKASSVFGRVRANLGKIAAAAGALFSAKLFSGAVESAEKLDQQMLRLRGVIQATGGAAGLTAEEVDKIARRLDEATTGSAEGFRKAAAQLLTFKSVGKDSFETVLELAQDLADAGFGSVEANAKQLGRALEDPVQGLSALRRAGVSFSAEQQNVIRNLVATGRAAEAQKIILEAVAGQVGGTARALGGGLSGALDLVKARFNELREQLGQAVLPVFQRFNERLADFYGRLRDTGAIKRFGELIASALEQAQEAFFKFFESVDLNALIAQMGEFAETARTTFEGWSRYIQEAAKSGRVAFGVIGTGLATLRTGFFTTAAIIAKFGEVVTGSLATAAEAIARLTGRFTEAAKDLRMISESFGESFAQNLNKATEAAERTQSAFAGTVDAMADLLGVSNDAGQALREAGDAAADAAKNVELTADQLDALGNGFEYVGGEARKAAQEMKAASGVARDVSEELDDAFKLLGIKSQASLDEAADLARIAFEQIRDSGKAATGDITRAFEVYAARAIEANNGVATAAIRAQAATMGLILEATASGDRIVRPMVEAAGAVRNVADEAGRAATAFESMAQAAARAAQAAKEAGSTEFMRSDNTYIRRLDTMIRDQGSGVRPIGQQLQDAATRVGSRR